MDQPTQELHLCTSGGLDRHDAGRPCCACHDLDRQRSPDRAIGFIVTELGAGPCRPTNARTKSRPISQDSLAAS